MKTILSVICSVIFFSLAAAPDRTPFFSGRVFPEPVTFIPGEFIPVSASVTTIECDGFPAANYAAELLNKRLDGVENPAAKPLSVKIVLSEKNDGKPESYTVEFDGNTVTGRGADNRGCYYAAAAIAQLIDRANAGMLTAKIEDYPLCSNRYVTDYFLVQPQFMPEFFSQWKINGYAVQSALSWRDLAPNAKPQFGSYPTLEASLKAYAEFYEKTGGLIDLMLAPRLYGFQDAEKFDCSNEEMIDRLIADAKSAAKYHVAHIMIRVDDVVPEVDGKYPFIHPGEEKRFSSMGQAHGYVMKRLYNALHPEFPGLKLSFCPGPYTIDSHRADRDPAKTYLAELAAELPDDVYVVWTGRDVGTPVMTRADTDLYQSLIGGHKLFTWHNPTMLAGVLCHPADLDFYPGFELPADGIFFANAEGTGKDRNRPADLTYTAYVWNPAGYVKNETYLDAAAKLNPVNRKNYGAFLSGVASLKTIDNRRERAEKLLALKDAAASFDGFVNISWFNAFFEREYANATADIPVINVSSGPLNAVVDGNLNDEIWKYHAAPFRLALDDGSEPPAGQATVGRVYFNSEAEILFLSFEINQSTPDKEEMLLSFVPTGTRSCNLWFDTDGNTKTWFHWVLEWKPEWKVKTVKTANGFNVEIALPLQALREATLAKDEKIKTGGKWGFQVQRGKNMFLAKPNPHDRGDVGSYGQLAF
ncbi:MAG: beta-N-acetylglucosaminidase domain-containing protein [Victivallaceae bacterium]|nr:beta-N-acetylglucosaminidase domain-containing protein [Victivallaceae bacterium]